MVMTRQFVKNCRKLGIAIHSDFVIGLPGETKETIQRTIEFAKELDTETIQVSVVQAFPGTELYDYLVENRLLVGEAIADPQGHQLPHVEYPGLGREEIMAAVNRFYDSYYFRPRVIWRIVRKALWSTDEQKRLYHEAVTFLHLWAERWKYARKKPATPGVKTTPTKGPTSDPRFDTKARSI